MPSYENDHRVCGTKKVTTYNSGWEPIENTYIYPRLMGVFHTFSGPSEGKFIPGVVRINEMTATRTTATFGSGTWTASGGDYREVATGILNGWAYPRLASVVRAGSDYDEGLVGYAVQRAHANVINAAWDAGEFLAELPETIAMVRTGIGGLLKVVRKASKSGFTWSKADRARLLLNQGRSIKKLPAKLANAWLTWRYGIRPIIWDVQDIIKVANGIAIRSDFSGLQRRRGRTSSKTSDQYEDYWGRTDLWGTQGHEKEFAEYERKAEAVVYFKYGSSFGPISDIIMRYGLHPNQLPSLLWQLRPLSFMLDWFVDVNTWVKAITPKWGMEILGCSCSQKTTVRVTRITVPFSTRPGLKVTQVPVSDTCVIERIVRRPRTLRGEFPRLKPQVILSVEQQADMLSVFLQRALTKRGH